MEQIKILAYITAYEDNKAVKNCVEALKNQSFPINKIFIIDNSQIEPVLLSDYNNIIIEHHPENIGIGAGLNIALSFAQAQDYDFLWAFDQDSVPASDCLEILLEAYQRLSTQYKIAIIAPTAIDIKTNTVIEGAVFTKYRFIGCKHTNQVNFYECDSPITSGSLISIDKAKTISPPRADLFIDGIDLDYGLRFKQKGYSNLIITKAIMQHNFGNPLTVNFLSKKLYIHKYSALRHYYICRNHTYLDIKYSQGWYRFISLRHRIKYLIYTIAKIVLFDTKYKIVKIWACLVGTFHGLRIL
ncbi:glycosyl transferase family protein [Calothrix sp. NIES-4071]|nr:glycosyl transferase family protein [Calothrix sp. NIES-4071]BAZ56062.1 glycosyl transferase family protein [Calothrix sp. NIES-4105]